MGNSSLSINLLKKEEQSFVDKFIHWALTIGRFVVILTEAIALSAFLYRFTLDRQLVDLHDSIKQKQAIINLLKDNEVKFRSLQERIVFASNLSSQGQSTATIVTDITNMIPSDMNVSSLSFTGDRIRIDAKVRSTSTLSQFINKLRDYEPIQTITLDRVENKISNATVIVSITAVLKKKGGGS